MLFKSFRLFVSSTFKDFAQERQRLQSEVFPALDTYCAARGYQFHAVDMRWGVNEEAQLDQRTTEICLGEVNAAKSYPAPNFFIMIGDRYGWLPLPFAIAQDEFEAALAWLGTRGEHDAVRDLRRVYQLDENHVIACGLVSSPVAQKVGADSTGSDTSAYTLRSREDEIDDLKDAKAWESLETRLRAALQAAADHLLQQGRIDAAGHQKYFLSLTEQEIIHGLPGYRRDDTRAAAGLTKQTDTDCPHAIAWIREPSAASTTAPEPGLDAVKAALRGALPAESVATAVATSGPDNKLDDAYLDGFASTIRSKLEAAIDQHITEVERQHNTPDAELQAERAAHRAFAEERRPVVGRESSIAAIARYIAGTSTQPLVVYGRSGSGKSALLASFVAGAEGIPKAARPPIVYRFIGASAASSDQRAMLTSLVDDLAAHGVVTKPAQWEDDANRLVAQVRDLLTAIAKPVVIAIDALDQLRRPYRPNWLPEKLPAVVKIIVSVLDDQAYAVDSGIYRSLKPRLPLDSFLEIEPLGAAHGHEILSGLEQAAGRRLQLTQREYVVRQFVKAGGSPLYLRVAFEIARGWRSTERMGPGGRELAADTKALIAQLIDELTNVHHHEPELVSRTLGYITAARDGLSAAELVDVLSRDAGVMQAISSEQHGARTTRLPVSVWVRLHHYLRALLVEKRVDGQPLLQFFHRQVAEVARERCYDDAKLPLHGALASYFGAPTGRNAGSAAPEARNSAYTKRSLSELPYQLFHADRRDRLDDILLSPDWMQQKMHAFEPQILVADYDDFGRGSMQSLIGRTLRLTTGICTRDPAQLLPQLIGRVMASSDTAAPDFLAQARRLIKPPALLTQRLSLTPPGAETDRLEGHRLDVRALAVLPDGRLASGSDDNTIRFWETTTGAESACLEGHSGWVKALVVLPDGRLASGSDDSTIRFWDTTTGVETARLVCHARVEALVVLPDGRLASGSDDNIIRFWDTATGAETARLVGHSDTVSSLVTLADGRLASSGSWDQTIRLWDTKTGAETARLEGHVGVVAALAVLPDARLASGSYDDTIRLWDTKTGAETFRVECTAVSSLLAMPDGRLAAGSLEKIRIFDANSGAETAVLKGHTSSVRAMAVLPAIDQKGWRLATGAGDSTIRLWDLKPNVDIARRLEYDSGSIHALTVLPGGRLASGTSHGTIRILDPNSGSETTRLEGHTDPVYALAALHDGRLASGSHDNTILLWDMGRGIATGRLEAHTGWIKALTVLPEHRLASGSWDETIRLWDLTSGAEIARFEGHTGSVQALALLPDGRLASGSGDGTIRLWDLKTGAETARLVRPSHISPISGLAVMPGGNVWWLLSCSRYDNAIRLWDPATGTETARLVGHIGPVNGLAVMPDGKIASCSDDRTIRVWNPTSGKEIARLEIDGPVLCLTAFSELVGIGGRLVAGDQIGRLHWLEIVD